MSFIHGKKSFFEIDNAAGSPVDLTTFIDDISFPRPVDTAETSTMGQDAKTYIVGLTDATISIKGNFDAAGASTPDPVLSGLLGLETPGTFTYKASSAATSSTNPEYSGECFCTSYEITSSVGDKVTFSAEFQVTGAVTRATT